MLNVFNYHDIGKKSTWIHTKSDFLNILDYYKNGVVQPELLSDIDIWDDKLHTLITIDDGKKSSLFIADELEKRGWYGLFFIPTIVFSSGYKNLFLSKQDIKNLHARGHMIGSHSHTHLNFSTLTFKEMQEEWKMSKKIIEDIISEPVITASIPNGDYSECIAKSAIPYFDFLFTSVPTTTPWIIQSIICIGRLSPKGITKLSHIKDLINFRGYWKEKVKYQTKKMIKILTC